MRSRIITLLLLFSVVILGQNQITRSLNLPREGDKLIKQQILWQSPGEKGDTLIWDFRGIIAMGKPYTVTFQVTEHGDTIWVSKNEHNTRYDYCLLNDSLCLAHYANRMVDMRYSPYSLQQIYPFQYGDTLLSSYHSRGEYCRELPISTHGTSRMTADAFGKILLPGYVDSLPALRLCHELDYLDIGRDSARMQMVAYSWYVRGFRYPVFESIEAFIDRDQKPQEHFKTSFYYSPVEQQTTLLQDLLNEAEWKQMQAENARRDSLLQIAQGVREHMFSTNKYCSVLRLYPIPVKNMLTISFELKKTANVTLSLYDGGFRLVRILPAGWLEAGEYFHEFDLSGLYMGEYHLHVRFNDLVVKEIILKEE